MKVKVKTVRIYDLRRKPGKIRLTQREQDVMRLCATGYSNYEIGRKLHITEHTVNSNMGNLKAKLGDFHRRAIPGMALILGLVSVSDIARAGLEFLQDPETNERVKINSESDCSQSLSL